MTRNKINREPTDPMWSGRLVQGADNGWVYEDCTLEHLQSHLEAALILVKGMRDHEQPGFEGHGVVFMSQAEKMANLFELVDNLQRYLPWVKAYAVGHEVPEQGSGEFVIPAHFEATLACVSKDQAEKFALYLNKLGILEQPVTVSLEPVPVLQIMSPKASPEWFANAELLYGPF